MRRSIGLAGTVVVRIAVTAIVVVNTHCRSFLWGYHATYRAWATSSQPMSHIAYMLPGFDRLALEVFQNQIARAVQAIGAASMAAPLLKLRYTNGLPLLVGHGKWHDAGHPPLLPAFVHLILEVLHVLLSQVGETALAGQVVFYRLPFANAPGDGPGRPV